MVWSVRLISSLAVGGLVFFLIPVVQYAMFRRRFFRPRSVGSGVGPGAGSGAGPGAGAGASASGTSKWPAPPSGSWIVFFYDSPVYVYAGTAAILFYVLSFLWLA
eukprot:jgi/Mesvir1/5738/Mv03805-RA.1